MHFTTEMRAKIHIRGIFRVFYSALLRILLGFLAYVAGLFCVDVFGYAFPNGNAREGTYQRVLSSISPGSLRILQGSFAYFTGLFCVFYRDLRAKAHIREFLCVFHRALLPILQGSFAYSSGFFCMYYGARHTYPAGNARKGILMGSVACFTGLFCVICMSLFHIVLSLM